MITLLCFLFNGPYHLREPGNSKSTEWCRKRNEIHAVMLDSPETQLGGENVGKRFRAHHKRYRISLRVLKSELVTLAKHSGFDKIETGVS